MGPLQVSHRRHVAPASVASLAAHERRDVLDAVEVLDARLVGFQLDAEGALHEVDELDEPQGVDDPAGAQRRVVRQVLGGLPLEELPQDEAPELPWALFVRLAFVVLA